MAEPETSAAPGPQQAKGRPWATAAKWIGIAIAGLLVLIGALLVFLNTDPGRRTVTNFIDGTETASGLRINIEGLEGSLYGELTIRGLTLSDPKGVFFYAPVVQLDWRPFAYLNNHIDIRSANIPQARLRRLPELRPSGDPDAPLLPDLDIDIGHLDVDRLLIDPAVTGQRHLLSIEGSASIADRRAQIDARALALEAPGIAGGDRLALQLDAVPEQNRLAIALRLNAPANGFVANMTGVNQAITAVVHGRGSWESWRGNTQLQLGGNRLADLTVLARNGTFTVDGPINPGLFLEGPAQRLVAPAVQLNLVAALDARRADLRVRMRSRALALAAEGLVDLGESRFNGLRIAARLLEPGAIAPDLRARDVRLALVLNGAFGAPRIAYDLQASAIGVEETLIEQLRARGAARVNPERIVVPISARAARISGLNPAIGGLLTNVRVDGSFAISGGHILSDNLRVRSDKLNATVVLVANLAQGEYRAAIDGTVNNYLVEGFGIVDLTSDFDLVSRVDGIGLDGRLVVRTRRIDNATARDLMGGNGIISARLSMNPQGVFTISDLRVSSPGLTITSGSGRYEPGGRIALQATGRSTAYGPLAIEISGTLAAPNIRLRATNPGFGIGLRDVAADVRSTALGFAVTASGQSRYGPFRAELTIVTGAGPLTLDIRELTIAGFTFSGRVVQTPQGPFSGTLTVSGSGIEGVVRLSAAGEYQRAELIARADGARIPGEPAVFVRRGIIRATAILYPQPSIEADVQLAGVRSGNLLVEAARARIDYQDGAGRVQLVAEGSSNVPFRIAANANLSQSRIRIAAQGSINRNEFRLERPANIARSPDGWRLAPVTVAFPQGDIRIAGRFGDTLAIETRFDDLDLSMVNLFAPGTGIGGRLNGSLDFVQPAGGGFPRGEARLTVSDFTRTGALVRSTPVDISAIARLGPEGGILAAAIRRSDTTIGRVRVTLQPLSPAAGSWTQRLLASPLGGGIRYNGPAEVLWSFTGIADHELAGPIGVAADFSGRVQNPQLTGVVRANNLTYQNDSYGTQITSLALRGRFTSSDLVIEQLRGTTGEGTVTGEGRISLAASQGYPVDLDLSLDRARLARSEALGATVSGTLAITNTPAEGALIEGDLRLPEARYQVVRQGAAEIAELEGVRRMGEPLPPPDGGDRGQDPPSIWTLDLRVRADNEVYISGMGLESEWETDLRVTGTSATPAITGRAELIRGTYSFGGRRFELTDGTIRFTGSRPADPQINIVATTDVDDMTAVLRVTGSSSAPNIALTSSPALPQDEILARLFFGNSVTELSATQAIQLAASVNALRGSGGGLNPLGKLRSATGFDRLRILGADEATGRGTAIAAGMHISNDIYVEVITDARGFTATQLEIALSRSLSVLSQVGSFGNSSFSVRYRKDY